MIFEASLSVFLLEWNEIWKHETLGIITKSQEWRDNYSDVITLKKERKCTFTQFFSSENIVYNEKISKLVNLKGCFRLYDKRC